MRRIWRARASSANGQYDTRRVAHAGDRRRVAEVLWIFGSSLGVDATTVSFVGLSVLLLSGVLTGETLKAKKAHGIR